MPRTNDPSHQQPSFWKAAQHGLCPRCGAQSVFATMVHFHPRCDACGYDLAKGEAGGRFAAILTLLVAALLSGLAMLIDAIAHPPLWLQVGIWAPLTMVCVVQAIRFGKAGLLVLRYMKAQQQS